MDEAAFWDLIDRARGKRAGKRRSADPEALRAVLERESDTVVASFGKEFARQMARLYRWSVWGAAYVVQGGASDDGFRYFCEGLVGKGRAAVEQALADPDRLGPYVSEDDEENENEGLGSVATEILRGRGRGERPSPYPSGDPAGERFDEERVYDAYPRLAARFG